MRDLRLVKEDVVNNSSSKEGYVSNQSEKRHNHKSGNDLGNALFRHFLKWRPELIPHIDLQNNVTDGLVYELGQ